MGGVLHLEATFHASTYDPAMVARALELVCTDPAALIMASGPPGLSEGCARPADPRRPRAIPLPGTAEIVRR